MSFLRYKYRLVVPAVESSGAIDPRLKNLGKSRMFWEAIGNHLAKQIFLSTNKLQLQKKVSKCRKIIKI